MLVAGRALQKDPSLVEVQAVADGPGADREGRGGGAGGGLGAARTHNANSLEEGDGNRYPAAGAVSRVNVADDWEGASRRFPSGDVDMNVLTNRGNLAMHLCVPRSGYVRS